MKKIKKRNLNLKLMQGFSVLLIFLVLFRISFSQEDSVSVGELGSSALNIGQIIFYIIVGVLILMIFLIIFTFIQEKNKENFEVQN